MLGRGRSRRTSASGSIGGPSSPSGTPSARCAAAGEKRSRPWNVRENVLERVRRVRELVRRLDAAVSLGRRQEQAVVGPDVEPPGRVAQRERASLSADAGVDDRKVHAHGHVRERVREHQRALQDASGPDAVGDVDHADVRRDARDDAVAGADEVVLEAEVGEEG